MKRTLFLTLFVSVVCAIGSLQAQDTYDIYQMTNEEFAAGGNKSSGWSFERYDKTSGTYTSFKLYGDSSRINQYDGNAYRFGGELKGEAKPEGERTGDFGYKAVMNALYDEQKEQLYIGEKSMKYETQATKQLSPAFVFTAPSEGYYKMEMTVQNQDAPTGRMDPYPMIVNRFRYANQENINYVNELSDMGKNVSYCQGGIFVAAGNEIPGGGILDRHWYTPFQPENYYFYFYAKQGDKITVEATYGEGEDNRTDFGSGHSLWNRTRWHALKATKVAQNEAEADARYVNPYGAPDRTVLDALANEAYDLQMEANPGKRKGEYPATAIATFNAVIESYDNADAAGIINAMTLKVWEITLANAIAAFQSEKNEVTWADHYKLFPFDKDDDDELTKHNAWMEEQGTATDLDAVRWKFYAYTQDAGTYEKLPRYDTGSRYPSANAWHGSGDWIYIATDGQIHPRLEKQNAVLFTAPVTGYYKVYTAIQSENTNDQMNARFRYISSTMDVNSMVVPKESFLVNMTYKGKGMPSDTSFYIKMDAGDRLTFEQDCYTRKSMGSAGSSWQRIALIDMQKEYANAEEIQAVIAADNERILIDPFAKGDFTALSEAIAEYKAFIASIADKVGDKIGNYPSMAKLTFEEVISEAEEMVADDVAAQYQIDLMKSKLDTAYKSFITSQVIVMCDPVGQTIGGEAEVGKLVSGAYYIKSPSGYYLTAPDRFNVNEDGTGARMPVFYSKKINPESPVKNAQVWNIQYNQAYDSHERKRYTFVTSLNDGNVTGGSWNEDGVGHFGEGGSFCDGNTEAAQSMTGNNHVWRNFSIFYDGTSYCFYNVEKQWSLVMIPQFEDGEVTHVAKMETTAGVKKYYYQLVPMNEDSGDGIYDDISDGLSVIIMGVDNSIVIANAEAGCTAEVYDISGRLVEKAKLTGNYETIAVNPGLYIIKVSGNQAQKTGKVIVR